MPRLPFLNRPTQLNLAVEEDLKREGHIYAAGQRRSISQMFADWLRPLIAKDKAANPERYGDSVAASQPTNGEGK